MTLYDALTRIQDTGVWCNTPGLGIVLAAGHVQQCLKGRPDGTTPERWLDLCLGTDDPAMMGALLYLVRYAKRDPSARVDRHVDIETGAVWWNVFGDGLPGEPEWEGPNALTELHALGRALIAHAEALRGLETRS